MSFRLSRLAVTAGLTLALAACGSSATTTAPSVAPSAAPTDAVPTAAPTTAPTTTPTPTEVATEAPTSGDTGGRTGRIEFPDDGFAVTLPDGWVEVGLSEDDIQALVDNLDDATAAEALRQQLPALLAAGVKLWAFDTSAGGAGSNLNVIIQPGTIPVSLLRPMAEQQMAAVPGIDTPEISDATVDGEDALRVDYTLDQATASGQNITATGTQVYVSTAGSLYVFTVTVPDGGSDSAADAIVGSIEFLD